MAYTTIDDPTLFFNTVLYVGTESSGKTVTGVGFQPDWVWLKNRTDSTNHNLYDSVRGGNGTSHYFLKSNVTAAEGTNTSSLLTIDSDGFTLGDGNETNGNSDNIVSWNWKAGTSFSNDASATSVGSIDSSGSINTTAGFSIISWTGTGSAGTIAHGLGAAPEMYWVKNRDKSSQFAVFHKDTGNTHYLALNDTDASANYDGYWNDTSPTSTVFSVGSDGDVSGASNEKVISYCFRSIKGYSKIGSYTGNGNANGPFVYLGFKPAWLLIRNKNSASENWAIYDNKRDSFNTVFNASFPNRPNADGTNATQNLDFLSNGFKCKSAEGRFNASGNTMIFMAFAESPFVNSKGIPNNGR